jgi:hypothetical protein
LQLRELIAQRARSLQDWKRCIHSSTNCVEILSFDRHDPKEVYRPTVENALRPAEMFFCENDVISAELSSVDRKDLARS